MQIWEKGKLIDMTVYFNDEVSLVDGEYQISRSYYSKDRVKNLKYTNTVLEGITINEEQVDVGKDGSLSWNKEYARKYHQPILEDFLDRYL